MQLISQGMTKLKLVAAIEQNHLSPHKPSGQTLLDGLIAFETSFERTKTKCVRYVCRLRSGRDTDTKTCCTHLLSADTGTTKPLVSWRSILAGDNCSARAEGCFCVHELKSFARQSEWTEKTMFQTFRQNAADVNFGQSYKQHSPTHRTHTSKHTMNKPGGFFNRLVWPGTVAFLCGFTLAWPYPSLRQELCFFLSNLKGQLAGRRALTGPFRTLYTDSKTLFCKTSSWTTSLWLHNRRLKDLTMRFLTFRVQAALPFGNKPSRGSQNSTRLSSISKRSSERCLGSCVHTTPKIKQHHSSTNPDWSLLLADTVTSHPLSCGSSLGDNWHWSLDGSCDTSPGLLGSSGDAVGPDHVEGELGHVERFVHRVRRQQRSGHHLPVTPNLQQTLNLREPLLKHKHVKTHRYFTLFCWRTYFTGAQLVTLRPVLDFQLTTGNILHVFDSSEQLTSWADLFNGRYAGVDAEWSSGYT